MRREWEEILKVSGRLMSANVIIRKTEVENKVWNVAKLRLCVLNLSGAAAEGVKEFTPAWNFISMTNHFIKASRKCHL